MERYNRVGVSFNDSGLSQRSAATFQSPLSSISLPPKPHLREHPISSYLRPESPRTTANKSDGPHRAVLRRAAEDTELRIFDAERYFKEDGQDADKRVVVLNGLTDPELSTNTRASSVSSADGYGRSGGTDRPYYSTPTASSEASWNSQSGLLSKPSGSADVTVRAFPVKDTKKAPPSSRGRRFFGRRCPCTGKKSVDVEDKYSEPKSPAISSLELRSFLCAKRRNFISEEANLSSIPEKANPKEKFDMEEVASVKITPGKDSTFLNGSLRLSPEKRTLTGIGHRIVNSGRLFVESAGFSFPELSPRPPSNFPEELARDSLEVFRPSEELAASSRKSIEVPQKVGAKPLPGEGDLLHNFTYPTSPKADDAASDASSDLFEIESLSTQMGYRRRDSLDELEARRFVGSHAAAGILQFRRSLDDTAVAAGVLTPSIAPSECYPPSEVSVQWSVATAEGFDRASVANFSSAASDYDEFRFMQAEHDRFAAAAAAGGGRRKSGGLLGCRSEKAVSVGPKPVRFVPPIEPEPLSHVAKMAKENLVPTRSHLTRMYPSVQSR